MPFEFGDVVLVRFPFTNQTAFKQRPAVVISNRGYNTMRPDAMIMAITSRLQLPPNYGEIVIGEWQAANLLKPSAIKPVFATIEQSLILKILGALQPARPSCPAPDHSRFARLALLCFALSRRFFYLGLALLFHRNCQAVAENVQPKEVG